MVTHTFNDSIWEVEEGRGFLFEFKTNYLAYIMKQVPGQLGLYSETVYKQTRRWTQSLLLTVRVDARAWAVKEVRKYPERMEGFSPHTARASGLTLVF